MADVNIEIDEVPPKIEVKETQLEDLIILGNDKLMDIIIEYPKDDGTFTRARAKIKQLTMKQLKNIDMNNINIAIAVQILKKSLYTIDEKPFTEDLILDMPVGIAIGITKEIMRVSGVDENVGKF